MARKVEQPARIQAIEGGQPRRGKLTETGAEELASENSNAALIPTLHLTRVNHLRRPCPKSSHFGRRKPVAAAPQPTPSSSVAVLALGSQKVFSARATRPPQH